MSTKPIVVMGEDRMLEQELRECIEVEEQTSIPGVIPQEKKASKPSSASHLPRETYKRIKHYNRDELETYLGLVYQNGVRDSLTMFLAGLDAMLDKVPDMTEDLKRNILDTINDELSK